MLPAPHSCNCRKQQHDARHLFTPKGTDGRSTVRIIPGICGTFFLFFQSFEHYSFSPDHDTTCCEIKRMAVSGEKGLKLRPL